MDKALQILEEKEEDFDVTELEAKVNASLKKSIEYQGLISTEKKQTLPSKVEEKIPSQKIQEITIK